MSQIFYTKDHEYLRVDGDLGVIGITDFAQQQLGDVVFVELPEVGAKTQKGAQSAVVESVKAASEVYAPVSGEIVEINGELAENPALVNEGAMDRGWFFKIRLADKGELDALLDESGYNAFLQSIS